MGDDPRDSFSVACGLAGPFKLRLEGPGSPDASPLEFRQPYLVVGKGRDADVSIDDGDVSRRHAYFQVVAGRVFCVDLGSRTGVRWGDEARPVGWVDPARGVGIGPSRICFEGDGSGGGDSLPISRSFEWGPLPDARLEFLGEESDREPWQMSRVLVMIGRSPTCRVQLPDPKVGNIHAALVRTPAGIWVVDLLGPGGVTVGGTATRSARLEDGDEVGLGDHRVRVRIGQAARPSGRSELARTTSGRGVRPASRVAGQDPSAAPDAMTARLLDEFDRIHQRTTEQFQQAILMMFRMHQDQMGVIRDELSRLDRLEDEQRSLRAEMDRGISSRTPRVALRLVSGGATTAPPSADPPAPARASSGSGGGRHAAPGPDARAFGDDEPPPPDRPAAGGHPASSDPDTNTDPDPHARLSMRLAEIQDERQGLWKKLLGSLTGGETGRIVP